MIKGYFNEQLEIIMRDVGGDEKELQIKLNKLFQTATGSIHLELLVATLERLSLGHSESLEKVVANEPKFIKKLVIAIYENEGLSAKDRKTIARYLCSHIEQVHDFVPKTLTPFNFVSILVAISKIFPNQFPSTFETKFSALRLMTTGDRTLMSEQDIAPYYESFKLAAALTST